MLIVRLLRDLANRSPTWSCLNDWLIEILVDKCFFRNKFEDITLKFRHVFECISSGVLLLTKLNVSKLLNPCEENDVLILADPCEARVDAGNQGDQQTATSTAVTQEGESALATQQSVPVRASVIDANLSEQQKEDLTSSAQHALRLIAFNKIHKVLGMDMVAKKVNESTNGAAKSNGNGVSSSQGEEQSGSQEENEGESGYEAAENDEGQEAPNDDEQSNEQPTDMAQC
jgi:zinc finger RNA-binding protein